MKKSWTIGIDEVGRGPLAGPVVVVVFALKKNYELRITNYELPLRDSKKLSKKQREEWVNIFQKLKKEGKVYYTIASVSPKVIDKINITQSANRAATRAFSKLVTNYLLLITDFSLFLDGGLYLQGKYRGIGKTVIKGDEKIPVISCASIIAKVYRDSLMKRMHKKYSQYGFDKHKGYGTQAHRRALEHYGISNMHRLTFLKNYLKMKSNKSRC